LYFNFYIDCIR
jgi:hypothetical protein